MLSLIHVVLSATTCDDVKSLYQDNTCCGSDPAPNIPFDIVPDAAIFLAGVYRTGNYANAGIPYADGAQAYVDLYNLGDPNTTIHVQECEHGYNTAKAVQCYYTHASRASAMMTLSTGSALALSSIPDLQIPLTAGGYGYGGAANDHVHFTTPSYEDAIDAFIAAQPTGSKVGFAHKNATYGLTEVAYFQSSAASHGLTSATFNMGFPAAWGYGVTNVTDVLLGGADVDAFFIMPFGGYGTEWLDAALALGIPASKFTSIWWGSSDVCYPRFSGVKIANFVDPNHSPVSLANVAVSDRLLYAQGMREVMLFAKLVEQIGSQTTFTNSGVEYPRDALITGGLVNDALAAGFVFDASGVAPGFTPTCHINDSDCLLCGCHHVDIFEYTPAGLTKM